MYKKIAMILAALTLSTTVHAAERHIHVNGNHLSKEDIQIIDHLANQNVTDGFYWINFETGAWGYEDNDTVVGYVDISRITANQPTQNNHVATGDANPTQGNKDYIHNYSDGAFVSSGNCSIVSTAGMSFKSCD
ncbi:MAG: hypothetical protein HOM11_17735 [Methylococcales bacterium]|jgi:hypothetical protein|nr:hypothetical protein [Methylococcales bacterium]MBT7442504.1 hypothetical protein [Methylococcales bacterium]